MIRFLCALTLSLAVAGPALATPPPNPVPSPEEAEINRLLDGFNAAAARADGKAYFDSFAPNAIFVGTDASERWTLPDFRAFAEPYFSQGKGWTYIPTSRTVTFAAMDCGCVAWFEENLDSASYGPTRGTGVAIKGPDGWKIGQYVLTIPIPNDIAKDVVADIKAFNEARARR